MSFAPWQRTQWASRIGCTSFAYVGVAGTSGLQAAASNSTAATMRAFFILHHHSWDRIHEPSFDDLLVARAHGRQRQRRHPALVLRQLDEIRVDVAVRRVPGRRSAVERAVLARAGGDSSGRAIA